MEIEVDDAGGHTSSEQIAAPPAPDETQERAAVPPGPRDQESGAWTVSALSSPPATGHDDWVVTNVSAAVRSLDEEAAAEETAAHDGTPVEVTPAPPALSENSFVAGEIDVPTPAPAMRPSKDRKDSEKTPAVEFTAASSLLGSPDPADPDTGSRTPPIEIDRGKPLPNRS